MKKNMKILVFIVVLCFVTFVCIGYCYYQMTEENKRLVTLKKEYNKLVEEMEVYSEIKNSYLLVLKEKSELDNSNVVLKEKINNLDKEINSYKVKIDDINKKIKDIS